MRSSPEEVAAAMRSLSEGRVEEFVATDDDYGFEVRVTAKDRDSYLVERQAASGSSRVEWRSSRWIRGCLERGEWRLAEPRPASAPG